MGRLDEGRAKRRWEAMAEESNTDKLAVVLATDPEGKPLGASNGAIRVSGSQDACEVHGVSLRSYE